MLDNAALKVQAVKQLSGTEHTVSLEESYMVQQLVIERRCARGESPIGVKMGFTSRAKMLQMGVNDLIWGQLTDAMQIEDGAELDLSAYVHPRVEPELAFLLKSSISEQAELVDVMQATEAVAPAMEIIDSRYRDFKFSLEDVVADNASSSGFVLGAWQPVRTNLNHLSMVLHLNGKPSAIGSSEAICGNPWKSLQHAARLTSMAGITLEPGWIVLAGAATAALQLVADVHVKTEVEQLGHVAFSVTGS